MSRQVFNGGFYAFRVWGALYLEGVICAILRYLRKTQFPKAYITFQVSYLVYVAEKSNLLINRLRREHISKGNILETFLLTYVVICIRNDNATFGLKSTGNNYIQQFD